MSHEKPPSGACAHQHYLLTCGEFDALADAFGRRCGICHRAPDETGHGYLCVDHDPLIGPWAVRGLLCSDCNSRLAVANAFSPAAGRYLADPWYARRIAQLGLRAEVLPEPPTGAWVMEGRRPWSRSTEGWRCEVRTGPTDPYSWERLNRAFGPHRISLLADHGIRVDTGEAIIAALRLGVPPSVIERHARFSAAYIRKQARLAGIEGDPKYDRTRR